MRAFARGRAAIGKVTFAGYARNYRLNGRNPFEVAWQFQADDGKRYDGMLSAMDPKELAGLVETDALVVLYDPNDPRANTVWIQG